VDVLSKIKPKYFQVSLGQMICPPIGERLKKLWDLEKLKISNFPCSMMRSHYSSRDNIIL